MTLADCLSTIATLRASAPSKPDARLLMLCTADGAKALEADARRAGEPVARRRPPPDLANWWRYAFTLCGVDVAVPTGEISGRRPDILVEDDLP